MVEPEPHAHWQPPSDYLALEGSEICRPTSEIVVRPRKEDQSPFAANLYKQKHHRWSTRNGINAYASEPAECCLWIQMWFVRCKLYRFYVPSPPSACGGTQTFRYWQAFLANYIGSTYRHLHQRVEEHKHSVIGKHFLEKHNLKRMNLNTNFKVLKKCRGKLESLIFEMLIIIRAKLFIY